MSINKMLKYLTGAVMVLTLHSSFAQTTVVKFDEVDKADQNTTNRKNPGH